MRITKAKDLDKLPRLSIALVDGLAFQALVNLKNKNYWSSTHGDNVLSSKELLSYAKDNNDASVILIYEGPKHD